MAEVWVGGGLHVEHGHERGAYNPVENPLEGNGNGHGGAADGVREYFGDEHPAYRSPRHHERRAVNHNANHRNHGKLHVAECKRNAERSYGHAYRAGDEQRLASPFLDGEYGDEREQNVYHAHYDCLHHRVFHAHVAEDARRVIEYGVDAYGLLEHAKHDADKDYQHAVCEYAFGLFGNGVLYLIENLLSLCRAVDFLQHAEGLAVASGHYEIARRLWHEAYQYGEQAGGYGFAAEHVAPAR